MESSNPIPKFFNSRVQFIYTVYIPRRAIQSPPRAMPLYPHSGKGKVGDKPQAVRRHIDIGFPSFIIDIAPPKHYTIWTLTHATLVALTHSLCTPFFSLRFVAAYTVRSRVTRQTVELLELRTFNKSYLSPFFSIYVCV